MKQKSFDYQGAIDAGYTDEEIAPFLREQMPNFDYDNAVKAGYSPNEINEFMSSYKPEQSYGEQAGRIAQQFGLGVIEGTGPGLAYEAANLIESNKPEATKDLQYKETVLEDIARLEEQKMMGVPLDEQDQQLYDHLKAQIDNPELRKQFNAPEMNTSIHGLAGQATGQDLHPEGLLEKSASWAGFLKDPTKIKELFKLGTKPKDIIKAIMPTGGETLRGLGGGSALQMAEDNEFGPIGTLAAAVVGDIAGHKTSNAAGKIVEFVKAPKQTLAKAAAKLTPKDKLQLQKDIIKDFREAGIQADLGSITNSRLVQMAQSRLSQSGLTGKAFEELKHSISENIRNEYKGLADNLGEFRYNSMYEAGDAAKRGIERIREADLGAARTLYQDAEKALTQSSYVAPHRLSKAIENLEAKLTPGSLKSTQQKGVLDAIDKLKKDITDSEGNLMFASVKDLINNKLALGDIIDWEVQGGAKQLLKGIVGELDRAIISHGKDNATFAKNYIKANKKFSEHAKTFRNKQVDQIMKTSDPATIMNKMNSVQGIKNLEKALSKTPEGKQLFDSIKRAKLDKIVGDNLIDSSTHQIKYGTFNNLLKKGNNREVLKEILGKNNFARLERLQRSTGALQEAANKFYNSSQSGTVATDAAIILSGFNSFIGALAGNPWSFFKIAGGVAGARKVAKLMTDPEFLKLTEEALLNHRQGNTQQMIDSFLAMKPFIYPLISRDSD